MKCPGQDTQFWDASAIFEAPCPQCKAQVEFFKDDTTRKCGQFCHLFVNPKMYFGCAAYCDFAEQCLGDLPPELVAQKEDLLKDRVAIAVKRHLKSDFKRIGRAARRARHAEQICRAEEGNLAPVLIAAYLWDLDRSQEDGSDAATIARTILADLKAPQPLVEKVCALITGRGEANGNAADHKVLLDAARIAELEDARKGNRETAAALGARIQDDLQTAAARRYAETLLLN